MKPGQFCLFDVMMVTGWFMFHVELRIMVVGKYVTVFTVDFKYVLVECGEHFFFF